ncbi:hypothetical protein ACWCXX_24045 [Streptomyces sp. NPDC001732]
MSSVLTRKPIPRPGKGDGAGATAPGAVAPVGHVVESTDEAGGERRGAALIRTFDG